MEVGPLGVTLMSIVPVFGSIRSRSPVWTKEQIPPAPTMQGTPCSCAKHHHSVAMDEQQQQQQPERIRAP